MKNEVIVITIDGPSGTGKGTVSHMLADRLKFNYLDSGAIYRVLAYSAAANGIDLQNSAALVALANNLDLEFRIINNESCTFLNDKDISSEIRQEKCGQDASIVAANLDVRKALLQLQKNYAKSPGLVTDGRDMGTVVFPNANLKIYLYASAAERAKRRYKQLLISQNNVSLAQVVDELALRDQRDTKRSHSPLKPADDAIQIDTTELTVDQVFDRVWNLVQEQLF